MPLDLSGRGGREWWALVREMGCMQAGDGSRCSERATPDTCRRRRRRRTCLAPASRFKFACWCLEMTFRLITADAVSHLCDLHVYPYCQQKSTFSIASRRPSILDRRRNGRLNDTQSLQRLCHLAAGTQTCESFRQMRHRTEHIRHAPPMGVRHGRRLPVHGRDLGWIQAYGTITGKCSQEAVERTRICKPKCPS